MRVTFSRYVIGAIIRNQQKISRVNKYDKVDLVATQTSDYREKAKEVLKAAQMRDAGKVVVKHPTLPNTWVVVSPEKAKNLTQKSNE